MFSVIARVFSALLIASLEEKSQCSIPLLTAASVSAIGQTAFYHNQNEKFQVELGQWDIQKILVGEGSLIEVVGGLHLMTNCYGT